MASARPSRPNPYVLAVLALTTATAVRLLLGSLIGHHLPFVTYYAAVAIVAFFGSLGAAVATTIAGGLLGREVAGRGDRTVGAIIGGAAGALAGRAIDRSDCRR